ncbi:transglutaminase [Burkholderia sp. SRS-46]|nr:transglutaminase [Burkholderia sp. SRS-46]
MTLDSQEPAVHVHFQPNVICLYEDISYTVNTDGTFLQEVCFQLRIETDQGVQEHGQISLRYSESLETLTIDSAYTTTADGERLEVSTDRILEQQTAESARAPMFDDNKVKVVVFPSVGIGATLTLRYRRFLRKPVFPGHFAVVEYFSCEMPRQATALTIHAPASMTLHVDAVDLPGGRTTSDDPDTQRWHWHLAEQPARPPEFDSVSDVDYSARVAVTTFPDFDAVGAAYLHHAAPQATVTPSIQALANKLTEGETNPLKQAEILYNWVSTNIRYVAIHFGLGGVIPHNADAVLSTAYGDCKDHVTLLEALLSAKNIRSSPVLVNSGSIYWLPKVALPLGIFDHVITYLPDFDLFADSTATSARLGTLPTSLLGKSALVIRHHEHSARVATLPVATPDNARVRTVTHITLDREGNVTGTSRIENEGPFDWIARQIFASIRPGQEAQAAARVLMVTGQDGNGTYGHSEINDLTRPFRYEATFQLPDYALFPGPGAIPAPVGLSSFSSIRAALEQAGLPARAQAMPYVGRQVDEITVIVFPDHIAIPQLPSATRISSPLGAYSSSYQASGQTITVTRQLALRLAGPLLEPAHYLHFREMARQIKRDLRTQLVYF